MISVKFSPDLLETIGYHEAARRFHSPGTWLREDVLEWLKEHVGFGHQQHPYPMVDKGLYWGMCCQTPQLTFADPAKALLFKLTWGGA